MIILFLLLIKFFYFYSKCKVQKNYIYTVLYSTLVVSGLILGLSLLSINLKFNWWILLYYFVSIIMLIDVVYFKHFNQLTTVNLLIQIKHLSTVGDSLAVLFEPSMLILVADLFIIPFLPDKILDILVGGLDLKVIIIIFLLFLLELYYLNNTKKVLKQEFMTYHGADLVENMHISLMELKKSVKDEELKKYIYASNKDDNYHGVAKDDNLIIIQVEALQNMLINRYYNGQEITPNLNKLIKNQHVKYFDHMFQSIGRGNTSDAEFAVMTGIYPPKKAPAFMEFPDRHYYTLNEELKKQNYRTIVCHGNEKHYYNRDEMYEALSFDKYYGKEDYEFEEANKIGFGINDEDFLGQTFEKLLEESKKGKFAAFVITLSSHTPFNMPEKYRELEFLEGDAETMIGRYMEAIHYADKALGQFFDKFFNSEMRDNTSLVLYGDHFGISAANQIDRVETARVLKMKYGYYYDDMMNIPLIMYNKNFDNEVIKSVSSQVDILPTLLNMYGIEKSGGIIFGTDIFNRHRELVVPSGYVEEGSFIYKDAFILGSRTGDFEDYKVSELFNHNPLKIGPYEKIAETVKYEDVLSKYAVIFDKIKL